MNYTGKNTIYDYLRTVDMDDGIHSMTLANDEVIDFEIINYADNVNFTENTELGNDTPDQTLVIVKCNKTITIERDIIVSTKVRKKGLIIFCGEKFINKGTLSMSTKGAIGAGQNVLIFTDSEGLYDFIPATGANGGEKIGGYSNSVGVPGNPGVNGVSRATGGGGSGAYCNNNSSCWAGAGSAGTSWSGGCGGGGYCGRDISNTKATDGDTVVGVGGNAMSRRTTANNWNATGGAGQIAGFNARRSDSDAAGVANIRNETAPEAFGTGGLIIVYCATFNNVGTIESNGSNSGKSLYNNDTHCASGGASGGGSINIYANVVLSEGTIEANGGKGAESAIRGGDGGNGCITFTLGVNVISTSTKVINANTFTYILNAFADDVTSFINKQGSTSIDDDVETEKTVWSSSKTRKEIDDHTEIDDNETVLDKTWSSDKVKKEIDIVNDSINAISTDNYLSERVGYTSVPVGTVMQYFGVVAPGDFLLCDGSVYSIDDYIDLAKFINANFGSYNYFGGDGETTFAVPNLSNSESLEDIHYIIKSKSTFNLEVKNTNIRVNLFNKDQEEIITVGTSTTNIKRTVKLNQSIEKFDELEFEVQVESDSSYYSVQRCSVRVNDIIYNNSETSSLPSTNSIYFSGAISKIGLLYWFKDEETLFLSTGASSISQWSKIKISNIVGIKQNYEKNGMKGISKILFEYAEDSTSHPPCYTNEIIELTDDIEKYDVLKFTCTQNAISDKASYKFNLSFKSKDVIGLTVNKLFIGGFGTRYISGHFETGRLIIDRGVEFSGEYIGILKIEGLRYEEYDTNTPSIDDEKSSIDSLWSSEKISNELKTIVDDTKTSSDKSSWSIDKIKYELNNNAMSTIVCGW